MGYDASRWPPGFFGPNGTMDGIARATSISPMRRLLACPFCREMFPEDEGNSCPDCDVALVAVGKLPPSAEADQLEEPEPLEPHMEPLPFNYFKRGRGALALLAVLGLVAFFLPWIHETAPEIRSLSGFDLARRLGWMWAPAVAWFVMLPLVLSRRSIYKMRGARVAIVLLVAIVVTAIGVRLGFTPESTAVRPVRFEWAWGLYASGLIAAATTLVAARFGGSLDDLTTSQPVRRGDEVVH